ncbi:SRPBCC family protein [Arthrobacter roseus]|uniref:SRPBCC family protein n=1 Tax=Arthrobacter roseus TaxID=136274 RepID=UPI0019638F4A|nr:SRPBCC family protein [Arthrobacter roseus]MBM7847728.1 uncharacterized protein YndB with AHSA1/START domain [Arthrobacter roseus]
MDRILAVSDSVVIAVDPASVYAAVSDVTRMGEWSSENTGATVTGGRTGAQVGLEFEGTNKRGGVGWVTRCTVTVADPGERFAFRVEAIGVRVPRIRGRVASWDYLFEAADGGTLVTETWTDNRRWPRLLVRAFDWAATGGSTFAEFQKGNIRRTLKKLKTVMEAG